VREIFLHSKYRYIFSFLSGIIIVIIKLCVDQGFTSLLSYTNGTFIAGFALICLGGLSLVNYFGGFDIFTLMVAKRDADGHKPTLYEHSLAKKEKRKKNKFVFVPYFCVGALFLITAIILNVIFINLYN